MKQNAKITVAIASLILAVIVFFVTKMVSERKFEENLDRFTLHAFTLAYSANLIANEYTAIWERHIRMHRNQFRFASSDFSEWTEVNFDRTGWPFGDFINAVNQRKTEWESRGGTMERALEHGDTARQILKEIDKSWFGSRGGKRFAEELYSNALDYYLFARNGPTGSLRSFNGRKNELSSNITRSFRNLAPYSSMAWAAQAKWQADF